jgi:glycosyltransferase involved in cell wall biosynthesis
VARRTAPAGCEARAVILDRTAIVHDWFQGYHGSERVVEAMRSGLFAPGNRPDVYTFHAARELLPEELASAIVRESRLAGLPGIRQRGHDPGRWRYLLPYMPRYFERLPLHGYELVISSSHACAVNVRPPPGAVHVCYCYTPMRYAWMPANERARVTGAKGAALRALAGRLRRIDLRASLGPDRYAAISTAVRERIERFYGRDSVVVHPPVDLDDLRYDEPKERGRFLWVNRLVAYKHPLAVAEAFRGTPFRLTMVGIGPLEERLRAMLPPNVELRGWVDRPELADLFARSSGFVHVGEEDFGISMVEALGSGAPVIALDRGGARDIVRDGVDGVLVSASEPGAVRAALEQLSAVEWDRRALATRAGCFSRERFLATFAELVEEARAEVRASRTAPVLS